MKWLQIFSSAHAHHAFLGHLSRTTRMPLIAALLCVSGFVCTAHAGDLSIEVSTLDGGRNVDLGVVSGLEEDGTPVTDVSSREIRLLVTNAGSSRYKVSQFFQQPPANTWNTPYPLHQLRCHALLRTGSGTVQVPVPTPVRLGEQDLFLSDPNGTDIELILIYELRVPASQEAGDYLTTVNYRVQSL